MAADPLLDRLLPQFRLAGETLLACGCNNSHSGNLSVRQADRIVVTRTGAMLGSLGVDDLVSTSLQPDDHDRARASSELPVHLAIYERTDFTAVAHGHAIWAVLAGWISDELVPIDVEGAYYFGRIPVVECAPATASPSTGVALAEAFETTPVAILRGHGVFAVGDSIEQAMQRVTSVNDSARLLVEAQRLDMDTDALALKKYLHFDHEN